MEDHSSTERLESLTACYEVSPDELSTLTRELLDERAANVPNTRQYVTIETNGSSKYANIGRQIERVVFEQAFGNDAEQMRKEYGPYEEASTFFISIDRGLGKATGVLRVIGNSPQGLKTLNDVQNEPFAISTDEVAQRHRIVDFDKAWDVGTIAVLPECRSGEGPVSVQLYRAMYKSALEHGIDHLVSIIDDKPLQKLKEYLAIPFVPLAGSQPKPYLGSEKSQAVYGYVPEFYKKMNRHMWTIKGLLARNALNRLVKGSEDDSLIFE